MAGSEHQPTPGALNLPLTSLGKHKASEQEGWEDTPGLLQPPRHRLCPHHPRWTGELPALPAAAAGSQLAHAPRQISPRHARSPLVRISLGKVHSPALPLLGAWLQAARGPSRPRAPCPALTPLRSAAEGPPASPRCAHPRLPRAPSTPPPPTTFPGLQAASRHSRNPMGPAGLSEHRGSRPRAGHPPTARAGRWRLRCEGLPGAGAHASRSREEGAAWDAPGQRRLCGKGAVRGRHEVFFRENKLCTWYLDKSFYWSPLFCAGLIREKIRID